MNGLAEKLAARRASGYDPARWTPLPPLVRRETTPLVVVRGNPGRARMNDAALRALGRPTGGYVRIDVTDEGEVRIAPALESPTAIKVSYTGTFGALGIWARNRGYRMGSYAAEVRADGALYLRLERDDDGNE